MADILRAQAQRAEANEVNSFEQQLAGLRNLEDEDFKEASIKEIKRKHENAGQVTGSITGSRFELPPEEGMDEKQKRFFEED